MKSVLAPLIQLLLVSNEYSAYFSMYTHAFLYNFLIQINIAYRYD